MKRLLYLAALCLLCSAVFAPAAVAQNTACDQVRDRLNAGDGSLTSAELLACGLSPEAIGAGPSINGPNGVGRDNACSGLPQGSPEAVACFEELIASRGTVAEQPEVEVKTETETEVKTESGEQKEEVKTEVKTETPKAEAKAGGTEAKAEAKAAKAEAKKAEAKKEEKKDLPKTGGVGGASLLALGAGALLVGGGLLIRRMR